MPDPKILHPNLATALVAARAEFTPVKKTHTAKIVTTSRTYEYRFATLDEINDATQPALQKHGLAIVQKLSSPDGGNVGIQTVLLFGAESLDCGTLVMPTGGTPQSIGSACTYGRRYGVTAALMIATEDDDDGQVAQTATAKAPAASPARKPEIASHEVRPIPRDPGDEPDDPFGDLSDPTDQAPPDAYFVTEVREKRGESPKGPWTLYIVRFSDGREASTFDVAVASVAKAAIDLRTPMTFTLTPGKKAGSLNLVSLEPAS